MVIGLTGGVGCGKSTVIHILEEEYNAKVFIADEIGREAMSQGTSVYWNIVQYYGEQVLLANGEINREKLAQRLFERPLELAKQNARIHPYVRKKIEEGLQQEKGRLCVIESAILLQAQYEDMCDEVWYVYADEEIRKNRLRESRGYGEERINVILQTQWEDAQYRRHCTRVITNNGTIEEVREQLRDLLKTVE